MTRIKRYISVIVLAAFTVMLLAGCIGSGGVSDISEKTKNEYKLYYLSIMQDNSMTAQLYKLALWYANLEGGDEYAMNTTDATLYGYAGGLTSGSYYYVGNSKKDTELLLNRLNNMVKNYGDRKISFKLYESTLQFLLGRDLYILGFTITISDDESSSSNTADEPTSSSCHCTNADETDTHCENCDALGCDHGEDCNCNN